MGRRYQGIVDATGKSPLHGIGRIMGSQRDDRCRRRERSLLSANRWRHSYHHEAKWMDRLSGPCQAAARDTEVVATNRRAHFVSTISLSNWQNNPRASSPQREDLLNF